VEQIKKKVFNMENSAIATAPYGENIERTKSICDYGDSLSLSNPEIIKNIVSEYKTSRFDLLAKDSDKIKSLVKLIAPHLQATTQLKAIEAANPDIFNRPLDSEEKIFLNMTQTISNMQNLYVFSLLSDLSKGQEISDITKGLRAIICESELKIANYETIPEKKDFASSMIAETIDEPVYKIAQTLELGKEKSFLDRIFH